MAAEPSQAPTSSVMENTRTSVDDSTTSVNVRNSRLGMRDAREHAVHETGISTRRLETAQIRGLTLSVAAGTVVNGIERDRQSSIIRTMPITIAEKRALRFGCIAVPTQKVLYIINYTIICLKSVCRRSQTAGRNSCTIASGDVSNLSYPPEVHPVTSSRLSSA